ncbi:MAG: hypothetical protein M5U01_24645 [Ardenticatenaceae bacterium]|nr:hypothetical protein [Ardenticatenaceae bacterium]
MIVDANSGAPLLWVGETGGRQVAALAFDLHASDLALRVAFPLLLANLVDALTLGPTGRLADQCAGTAACPYGQPLALPVPPAASTVEVVAPDGRSTRLTPDGGQVAFAAEQLGLYEVRWPETELPPARFAVNLFSPQESKLTPVANLTLATAEGSGAATPEPLAAEGRHELWRVLALVALAVLLVEWLVAQRDARVRLQAWWRARRASITSGSL